MPYYQTKMAGDGNGRTAWQSTRELLVAIKEIGIPGAIAVYVVYMGATELPKLTRSLDKLGVEVQLSREQMREHIAQMAESIRIAKQACRNAAGRDENARRFCD